jgi:MFS family permease
MLPFTAMVTVIAPQAGRYAQRHGSRRPLTFGLLTAGIGLVLLSRATAGTEYVWLGLALLVTGIGMASTLTPTTAAVMGAVGPERAGLGSSTVNTSREVGGVLGIAVLGTVLTAKLKATMGHMLASAGLAPAVRDSLVESAGHGRLDPRSLQSLAPEQAATVRHAFERAFMDGWHIALLIAAAAVFVAAVVAVWMIAAGGGYAQATTARAEATAAHP